VLVQLSMEENHEEGASIDSLSSRDKK